ncbi:MAG: hypothetical protein ACRBI6_04510 [Acidimicrobiales bacterium]
MGGMQAGLQPSGSGLRNAPVRQLSPGAASGGIVGFMNRANQEAQSKIQGPRGIGGAGSPGFSPGSFANAHYSKASDDVDWDEVPVGNWQEGPERDEKNKEDLQKGDDAHLAQTMGFRDLESAAEALGVDAEKLRQMARDGYAFDVVDGELVVHQGAGEPKTWEEFTKGVYGKAAGVEGEAGKTTAEQMRELLDSFGAGEIPKPDQAKLDELLATRRQRLAMEKAEQMQALMERGSRMGMSPEQSASMQAQIGHESAIRGAEGESQIRYQQGMEEFKSQMAQAQRNYAAAMAAFQVDASQQARTEAAAEARKWGAYVQKLQRDQAEWEREFGAASNGDIGATLMGAGGAILGGAGGFMVGGPAGMVAGGTAGYMGGQAAGSLIWS